MNVAFDNDRERRSGAALQKSGGSERLQKEFCLGYQPGLDGVRGIAIIFVLLSHGLVVRDSFSFIAVNTFFVLSGFLITALLVSEWDRTGGISLKKFYLRRALRLLPALSVMLVLFVVFVCSTDPPGRAMRQLHEALRALFYVQNWASIFNVGRSVSLAHTWSLSVEEQFYIVWPWMLIFLLRKTNRASVLCWLFLAAFVAVVYRIGIHMCTTTTIWGNVFPVKFKRVFAGTDTRADSLLFGSFAGALMASHRLPSGAWLDHVLKYAAPISGAGLLLLCFVDEQSAFMIRFGWALASLLAMTLIGSLVLQPAGGWLSRCFAMKPLVFIGRISYGLYIWHYPILMALKQHHWPWKNMIYLVFVIPVVLASYYLVERPCLRLKSKLENRGSSC